MATQDQHHHSEEVDFDLQTQQLLLAAAHHDLPTLQELLKTIPATVQDEETGYTPLHAAIAACVDEDEQQEVNGTDVSSTPNRLKETLELAEETLRPVSYTHLTLPTKRIV